MLRNPKTEALFKLKLLYLLAVLKYCANIFAVQVSVSQKNATFVRKPYLAPSFSYTVSGQ